MANASIHDQKWLLPVPCPGTTTRWPVYTTARLPVLLTALLLLAACTSDGPQAQALAEPAESSAETEEASLVDEPGWSLASDMDGHWLSVVFLDRQKGFAAMNIGQRTPLPGLYRTGDGGTTWSRVDHPELGPLSGITEAPDGTLWVWGDHRELGDDPNFFNIIGKMIASSSDGGDSWQVRREFSTVASLSRPVFSGQTGWILENESGGGMLLRTSDGGENWESVRSLPGGRFIGSYLRDERNGWISGFTPGDAGTRAGLILHTSDGGTTWTPVLEDAGGSLMAIAVDGRSRLWAVGQNGLVFRSDEGEHWEQVDLGSRTWMLGIGFRGERGFIYGRGETFMSTDGGETWHRDDVLDDLLVSSIFFIDEENGWLASPHDLILRYRAP